VTHRLEELLAIHKQPCEGRNVCHDAGYVPSKGLWLPHSFLECMDGVNPENTYDPIPAEPCEPT
jgi:hypothetical protein